MSTSKHIDKICIAVVIFSLLVTILFMNGKALGIKVLVDEDAEENEDNKYFTSSDLDGDWDTSSATQVAFDGTTGTVSGGGAYMDGSDLIISQAGYFVLTGTLDNGSVIVSTNDQSKVWIMLNGVSINSDDDACIRVEEADKTFVTLAKDTENTLTCGSEMSKEAEALGVDGAIFAKDDLTINGSGSLAVTSEYKHGISGNDDLIITGGTISVTAPADTVRANDSIRVTTASITADAGDDGLFVNHEDGYLYIKSGTFNLTAEGDAVHTGSDIDIEDGKMTISAGDDGIHSDTSITINGGTINIEKCYEGIEAIEININGGDITVYPEDDGINASSGSSGTGFGFGFGGGNQGGGMMGHGDRSSKETTTSADGSTGESTTAVNGSDSNSESSGSAASDGTQDKSFSMPDGEQPSMPDGEQPSMPDGEQPSMPDGEQPSMPDGEQPSMQDGEQPSMPDGEQPSIPDGEQPSMQDGEVSSMPDGETPSMPDDATSVSGENSADSDKDTSDSSDSDEKSSESSSASDLSSVVNITGGTIRIINSQGRDADGIDSNGDIIIDGGFVLVSLNNGGSNCALDYGSESGGTLKINGGTVIACGGSSMIEEVSDDSEQPSILYTMSAGTSDNSSIVIKDSDGNEILNEKVDLGFSSAIISCSGLKQGETYSLTIGDTSEDITLDEVAGSYGTEAASAFGGGGQGGGHGMGRTQDSSGETGSASDGTGSADSSAAQQGNGSTPPGGFGGGNMQGGSGTTPPSKPSGDTSSGSSGETEKATTAAA